MSKSRLIGVDPSPMEADGPMQLRKLREKCVCLCDGQDEQNWQY